MIAVNNKVTAWTTVQGCVDNACASHNRDTYPGKDRCPDEDLSGLEGLIVGLLIAFLLCALCCIPIALFVCLDCLCCIPCNILLIIIVVAASAGSKD
jgi:hypothetical protein